MLETISIEVDSDVACLYRSASQADRRKLDLLLNMRLHEVAESGKSLQETMREISNNAQMRGLTPKILESILKEERS